jgi:hypothetical protein
MAGAHHSISSQHSRTRELQQVPAAPNVLLNCPKGEFTMEMFLMILLMSVLTFAIAAIGFKASERGEFRKEPAQPAVPALKPAPERFFSPQLIPTIPVRTQVPIEVLLQQIENHVRVEQAAAESFVQFPTQAHLHTKTPSPFVN